MIRLAAVVSSWLVAVGFVGLMAGGCAPAPAAKFVEQADRIHTEALASADIKDRDLHDYAQQIGQRIVDAAKDAAPDKAGGSFFSGVQFHLIDTSTINVFETGGRHIYVYGGLLQFCENEEELAAAMCHAFAHSLNLDVEHTGIRPDERLPLPNVGWNFVTNRFTAAQEASADKLAFEIYRQAGWDPSKFQNLFQRLRDRFQDNPAVDRPSLNARAEAAAAWGRDAAKDRRKPPVADRRTFAALKKQVASLHSMAGLDQPGELYLMAFPNCLVSHDLPEEVAAQQRLRPPPPPAVKLEPN